ncbi:transporter substrate-binding domain-containing protein [Legionella massiliensis]|nr:transporter substrate-binding domain-containing protein [Legionella massiliensis]
MKMRIFPIIIFLLACLFNISSYAVVRIGTPLFQPPFAINVQNMPIQGFDIALMKMVCERMKWQCEFIPIVGNDFFTALVTNKIDFAIGGIVITPARRQAFLFSTPYLPSKAGFVTLTSSPIKTLDDLRDKRVGALKGKVYIEYLSTNFPIPVIPSSYSLYGDLILALKNDEIDAVFLNYDTALYLAHQHPSIIRALNEKIPVGEGMGILTTFDHSADIDEINKILLKNEEDGTFVKLYNYYFQFFIAPGNKVQN